jgi:hypothetical protein
MVVRMSSRAVMFLDESGHHGLVKIDPDYPLFVLGGIIVVETYAYGELTDRIQRFKRDLFGRDDLILHTADITRNKNGFEQMKEAAFRSRFFREINQLMRELTYTVVACVIKKDEHLAQYGFEAVDPYMLSLDILVERFCFELDSADGTGNIIAEKRSPVLDRQLDIAWLNLKVQGTHFVQAIHINQRISSLISQPKQANIAGLQLADLVISPIGRHVLGKQDHEDWEIVERKFRKRGGSYEGAGLVILPNK